MRSLVAWVAGVVETLLVVRLVARLFAARPDNRVIHTLYTATDPLIAPLRMIGLDAHQPRFGAVLELSTLALITLILIGSYFLWWWLPSNIR
jgi:uncharacterized protein YggT (Ycf19 family)